MLSTSEGRSRAAQGRLLDQSFITRMRCDRITWLSSFVEQVGQGERKLVSSRSFRAPHRSLLDGNAPRLCPSARRLDVSLQNWDLGDDNTSAAPK
jgi:hypothetical protein